MATSIVTIGCLALSVLASFVQGIVNFNNTPMTFPDSATVDRFVYGPDGNRLAGRNWAAALYFGTQAHLVNSLATLNATDTSLASALGLFRIPATVLPGTWVGGHRTLLGTSPGQMVHMQVRVWDVSLYESFDVAKASGGIIGQSAVFAYTI